MQNQQIIKALKCPNCEQAMHGYSVSYHNYQCSNCGTHVNGLSIKTNSGFEGVIAALCVVGLLALFGGILKSLE